MGTLRRKMENDMIIRGYAPRTRDGYLRAVIGLVKFYGCAPDRLSDQQVQAYLAHLARDRGLAWSSCNVAAHGLRFFFHTTLGHERAKFVVPAPRVPSRLPEILSPKEITRLFDAANNRRDRALLMTTYAGGLRVSEVVTLRISDVDSSRGAIRIEQGKGARDRYTLLSKRLVTELRSYWRAYRPDPLLFPGRTPQHPISTDTARRIYAQARARAGIRKQGSIHSLRHAFATHLLEAGTDIYTIQQLLGHRHITSTLRYIHLARNTLMASRSPLDLLEMPVQAKS